jgi:hypothetical protein
MAQLGIGAMLHRLGGGSANSADKYYGRTICGAEIKDNRLVLTLDGPQKIEVWDDGQSCCENRYMTCDDDLSSLIGHKLARIEAKDAPNQLAEHDEHECVFVEVGTDNGFITVTNHNEHNGYYGGFRLTITEVSN